MAGTMSLDAAPATLPTCGVPRRFRVEARRDMGGYIEIELWEVGP